MPKLFLLFGPKRKMKCSRNVQAVLFDYKNLFMRITNREFILQEKFKSIFEQGESPSVEEAMEITESSLNTELEEGLEELNCWLAKAEDELDACPAMAPLPKMQDGLSKFKAILKEVDGERDKLSSINNSLEDSPSPMTDKLKKVNERWERIVEALSKRVTDIEKCIEKQRQFEEETSGLRSWLGEVEVFLEAEEAAVGDIETLQAQLEQSNALQDDIETLKSNVISIGVTAQHFQSAGDLELKENVSSQLALLTDRWENAIAKAAQQNASLKDALQKSRKVWKEMEELNSWLDGTESEIPAISAIETTSELNTSLSLITKIKDNLDSKVDELEDLNGLDKKMMNVEKAQQCSELAQMLEDLNDRWRNLSAEINARHGLLSTCKENYENFRYFIFTSELSSAESKWLDQLEEKLEKSKLKITDAEEISAALYDLDEFLRSHSNALERAQKIGESLTSSGVMTVAVQSTIHNLSSRFDNLSSKAHEEQQRLEGGAEEAQDLERDYVSVLENLSSSLALLDQVPKEIQLSEIEKQLITHQEVLQKMQQRIEAYRSQGNTQAAQRLQDQLTHLVKY
ncbi:Dystrophin [Armadillidium nasatum]|uniref:Dystrophin n=1 Tax=Armadillidium nasatum TaxID=96803 RepID=A0A5N5TPD5_9CRUS|nr:Dystrophin [Armadillidium nasatum]